MFLCLRECFSQKNRCWDHRYLSKYTTISMVGIERHCSQPRLACPGLDQKCADDDVSGAAQLKILELPCTAQHIRLRSKVSMCSDTDNLFFLLRRKVRNGVFT